MMNKRLFHIVAFVIFAFAGSSSAYAACVNPAGDEGNQIYNSSHSVMQYCDGTNWISMASDGDTVSGLTCTDGQIPSWDNGGTAWVCATPASGADDLGDHTATTDIDAATNDITNINSTIFTGAAGDAPQTATGGSGGGTPTGAVMAFDLSACPSGWTEYAEAKGRFIRGACLDGTGCNDSDGVRAIGSTQTDELKSHSHPSGVRVSGSNSWGNHASNGNGESSIIQTSAFGGSETRPKNVALLYCRKD